MYGKELKRIIETILYNQAAMLGYMIAQKDYNEVLDDFLRTAYNDTRYELRRMKDEKKFSKMSKFGHL